MNDTIDTTVELVEVPATDATLVPGDGEASQQETTFIAEDNESVSVPYDA
jgi:hypothetical protein